LCAKFRVVPQQKKAAWDSRATNLASSVGLQSATRWAQNALLVMMPIFYSGPIDCAPASPNEDVQGSACMFVTNTEQRKRGGAATMRPENHVPLSRDVTYADMTGDVHVVKPMDDLCLTTPMGDVLGVRISARRDSYVDLDIRQVESNRVQGRKPKNWKNGPIVRIDAHRLVLWACRGPPPTDLGDSAVAMHLCDCKACINPCHLRWGSPSDNRKGHAPKGMPGVDGYMHLQPLAPEWEDL
jgi:hypothetical protein